MPSKTQSLRFFLRVQAKFYFLPEHFTFLRNETEIDGITNDGGIVIHLHVGTNPISWATGLHLMRLSALLPCAKDNDFCVIPHHETAFQHRCTTNKHCSPLNVRNISLHF